MCSDLESLSFAAVLEFIIRVTESELQPATRRYLSQGSPSWRMFLTACVIALRSLALLSRRSQGEFASHFTDVFPNLPLNIRLRQYHAITR